MKILRHAALAWLGLVLLIFEAPGCGAQDGTAPGAHPVFAEKLELAGISGAAKVNEFLYRGSQPNQQGVEQLKKLGVDTIVDLRGEWRGTMETERRRAESLGMQLVNIRGSGWTPPQDEQMAQFFALMQERPRRRVFVHCWLGNDRSGVFIAAYRIAFDGWNPEQALAEMRAFHFHGFWHPAMKAYFRDFPARLKRSAELAPYRQNSPAKAK